MTSDDDMTPIRGSGNVFRDFGDPNPEVEQLRALLASQVIKSLDAQSLSVRKAQELTGINASEFSRIRQVKLERFTIDRLINVLERLGEQVEVEVSFRSTPLVRPAAPAQLQPA